MVYVIQVCRQLSSRIRMEHHPALICEISAYTVVGFIIKKLVSMHGHTNVKYVLYRLFEYRYFSVLRMNNSKLSDTYF
jgi:hypothetical protein